MNHNNTVFHTVTCFSFLAAALLVFSTPAFAATRTWDGGGADNLASNALNWSSNIVPVANDAVVFNATSVKNCTYDISVTFLTDVRK